MFDIDLGGGFQGAGPRPKSKAEFLKEQRIQKAKETVLVVSPKGSIVEVHVPPPLNGAPREQGHVLVVIANSQYQIAAWAKEEGYSLFRDMCDEEPEKYKQYREIMLARAEGLPVRISNRDQLYPRKLIEYRERVAVNSADGKAYVVGEGVVDDPDVKARLDKKLRSMGLPPPDKDAGVAEPTPASAERAAAIEPEPESTPERRRNGGNR